MFQRIFNLAKGRRDGGCSLYVLDQTALVFPQFGIATAVEHGVVCALEAVALGGAVQEALRTWRQKAGPVDLTQQVAAFEARMEVYRLEIGAGKQRFMRDLQHVSAYRKDGILTIYQYRPDHGRFAFEGTGRTTVLKSGDQDDPQVTGAAVLTLLQA